jgi:TonB family protein
MVYDSCFIYLKIKNSKIIKQIVMKTKTNSRVSANLKIFMVLSLIVVTIILFTSCGKNKVSEATHSSIAPPPPPPPPVPTVDSVYASVDERPLYPGGDSALLRYIGDNTSYPSEAKLRGIQGKVITRFKVKADGTVSDVSVVKGVNPLLDNEAARVVATLPKFTPGKQDGKNVPVWYFVPITFALK